MTKKKGAPSSSASLSDFAHAKRLAARRAACAICALPDDIRLQMREARDRKIDVRTIREWLSSVHGIQIGNAVFTTHGGGHHDQADV